jgi:hypothetical protein
MSFVDACICFAELKATTHTFKPGLCFYFRLLVVVLLSYCEPQNVKPRVSNRITHYCCSSSTIDQGYTFGARLLQLFS